jgi:hypothetical protein
VIIFTVELEELRELWLIGAETMEGWEGCGEKEEKKGESVSISDSTDVTNISPHRMYEMYMFGKYLLFSDIILTDTFALGCSLWVHRMC